MKRIDKYIVFVVPATIIVAWFVGVRQQEADLRPFIKQALPEAERFEPAGNLYVGAVQTGPSERIVGYVTIQQAGGYGGPMTVAVGLDLSGNISGITIVDHKESAAYLQRVFGKELPATLVGKKYSDSFIPGDDVVTVTGATCTVSALTESVRKACREVADKKLHLPLPPEKKTPIKFGLPEIVLALLFGVGFAGYRWKFKHKKLLRWASLLTGLIILGFVCGIILTLANVNSLLLGYWPGWQSHLYWYFLIVGVLLSSVLIGRSPYCYNFCPFGAVQDCLAAMGRAKSTIPPRYHFSLRCLQKFLAWGAIILALVYRNPSLSSYEVFGTLFNITGSRAQFVLLAIVLVASLFIMRPWCSYLCPLRAVTDYIRLTRKCVREWASAHKWRVLQCS